MTRRARPEKFLRKPSLSLVDSMPTISTSGRDTRSSRSASAAARPGRRRHCGRRRATARFRRQQCRKLAVREPLHARRPVDPRHAGLEGRRREFQARRPQSRDRGAGILELMPAVELRRRQIEQAVVVLIDQPAALFGRGPVLAGNRQRRAHARRLPLDDGERLARLVGDDRRHVALENAGLLGGDLLQRIAEKFAMIERQRA